MQLENERPSLEYHQAPRQQTRILGESQELPTNGEFLLVMSHIGLPYPPLLAGILKHRPMVTGLAAGEVGAWFSLGPSEIPMQGRGA